MREKGFGGEDSHMPLFHLAGVEKNALKIFFEGLDLNLHLRELN